jgi:hypothetical protein
MAELLAVTELVGCGNCVLAVIVTRMDRDHFVVAEIGLSGRTSAEISADDGRFESQRFELREHALAGPGRADKVVDRQGFDGIGLPRFVGLAVLFISKDDMSGLVDAGLRRAGGIVPREAGIDVLRRAGAVAFLTNVPVPRFDIPIPWIWGAVALGWVALEVALKTDGTLSALAFTAPKVWVELPGGEIARGVGLPLGRRRKGSWPA